MLDHEEKILMEVAGAQFEGDLGEILALGEVAVSLKKKKKKIFFF